MLLDQENSPVVYDLQTGERLTETFPESNAISFSPNNNWLIGSTGNNATRELLVDLNAGQSYLLRLVRPRTLMAAFSHPISAGL